MNAPRVLYHMIRADFLERVRRYSFLVTLAAALLSLMPSLPKRSGSSSATVTAVSTIPPGSAC